MPIAPTLETERLILRQPQLSDAFSHNTHFNDYDVTRYLGSRLPWPYPENGSEAFLKMTMQPDRPEYYWAITLKENTDEMIGAIDLRPHIRDHGQRGFWLGKSFHNRGIMTETCFATNDFWFDTLNEDALILENALGNTASHRIKEKTGAVLLATLDKPGAFLDPELTRSELWLLTRSAWKNFKAGTLKHDL